MLHEAQFAYRKKTSTEHAVLTMTEEWRKKLDLGLDVIALFLDLSKAFDIVDHKILLDKLAYYNFHPKFISLIKNYLENRSIKVNPTPTEWVKFDPSKFSKIDIFFNHPYFQKKK